VLTDLVISPFGASVPDIVATAQVADAGGFDTVWTYDHFSGLVSDAPWSRDPFVTLGAVAATTHRIGVGVLVANMTNRHTVQLACALSSLQSLAPDRVHCGIGTGASPGSRFAAEHDAIGKPLAEPAERRWQLVETIAALRAIWRGEGFRGEHVQVAEGMPLIHPAAAPPIIVGATTLATIEVAAEHADGVNIQRSRRLAELVDAARRLSVGRRFEISVFDSLDLDHPLGGDPSPLGDLGVDRRTLYVSAPYSVERIGSIATKLAAWNPANG
jgi:alkanesulfonate monooxygenase SsuD/methylene tetrahydromethanopterin reductase-like flavin-dependent oxidoreductase (luciferase family)